MTSQRRPNFHVMGNPAVCFCFVFVSTLLISVAAMVPDKFSNNDMIPTPTIISYEFPEIINDIGYCLRSLFWKFSTLLVRSLYCFGITLVINLCLSEYSLRPQGCEGTRPLEIVVMARGRHRRQPNYATNKGSKQQAHLLSEIF